MANPRNLQELADSLAVQAGDALDRMIADERPYRKAVHLGGYRDALLDTRVTVLAMIAQEA